MSKAFTKESDADGDELDLDDAAEEAADAPLALPSRKRQPGRTACVMCACVQKAAPST